MCLEYAPFAALRMTVLVDLVGLPEGGDFRFSVPDLQCLEA